MKNEGTKAVMKALEGKSNLIQLDIAQNDFSEPTTSEEIAKALKDKRNLEELCKVINSHKPKHHRCGSGKKDNIFY